MIYLRNIGKGKLKGIFYFFFVINLYYLMKGYGWLKVIFNVVESMVVIGV